MSRSSSRSSGSEMFPAPALHDVPDSGWGDAEARRKRPSGDSSRRVQRTDLPDHRLREFRRAMSFAAMLAELALAAGVAHVGLSRPGEEMGGPHASRVVASVTGIDIATELHTGELERDPRRGLIPPLENHDAGAVGAPPVPCGAPLPALPGRAETWPLVDLRPEATGGGAKPAVDVAPLKDRVAYGALSESLYPHWIAG